MREMEMMEEQLGVGDPSLLIMPESVGQDGKEENNLKLNERSDSALRLLAKDDLESPKMVASLARSDKEEEKPNLLKDDIRPSSPSELHRTLQQISKDIDLSNDKVLETIAFLETPTPNEDQIEEEPEALNKKERERRDLEMLLDEDEGMFHGKEQDEVVDQVVVQQEECTKDSIMAWLGNSVVSAEDDSDFVYVSPWADEDVVENEISNLEDRSEQRDSAKEDCSERSSYENLHETPIKEFGGS